MRKVITDNYKNYDYQILLLQFEKNIMKKIRKIYTLQNLVNYRKNTTFIL